MTQAIDWTLQFIGLRVYGAHILMLAGRVTFFRCTFSDQEVLAVLTDRIRFGDNLLVRWIIGIATHIHTFIHT